MISLRTHLERGFDSFVQRNYFLGIKIDKQLFKNWITGSVSRTKIKSFKQCNELINYFKSQKAAWSELEEFTQKEYDDIF